MTLRVTVEIIPHGDETQKWEIDRIDLYNTTQDEWGEISDYIIKGLGEDDFTVKGHHRSDGTWRLIQRILNTYY